MLGKNHHGALTQLKKKLAILANIQNATSILLLSFIVAFYESAFVVVSLAGLLGNIYAGY